MRIKKLSLSGIERTKLFLGYVGENEHTQIRFDASCIYTDNPGARAGLTMQNPAGTVFPIVLDADGNEIIWNVSASDVAIAGNGSYQLTFTDNDEIIKTFIGQLFVLKSLTSAGDIPTPIENWIDQANQKLAEVEAATESIDNMDASATKLSPDASPTVTVSDVDGHKHLAFGIPQGEKGDKGEKGDTYEVTPENIEEISSRVVQSATIAQYTEGMADQVEAAQQHAKDAGDSATAADSSKKSAAQSAQAASQSATAADTSARNAAQSATNAGNSAQAADRSAQAASQSATNAAQSERNAADSAQDAQDVLDSIPADYSALTDEVTDLKSAISVTTVYNVSKNLYDPSQIAAGYINQTNGDVGSSTTKSYSDWIPVGSSFVISVESITNSDFRYAIYNANKTYISGGFVPSFTQQDGRYYLLIQDVNAAYFRFSDRSSLMTRSWQVENGSAMTSYEAYYTPYYGVNENLEIKPENVYGLPSALTLLDTVNETISNIPVKGSNIVTADNTHIGICYANYGNIVTDSTVTSYRYISATVKQNTRYFVNLGCRYWILADANDSIISSGSTSISTYYIDTGIAEKLYYTVTLSDYNNGLIISEGLSGSLETLQKPDFISGINQNVFDSWFAVALTSGLLRFTVGLSETLYYHNMLALEKNVIALSLGEYSSQQSNGVLYAPTHVITRNNSYGYSIFDDNLSIVASLPRGGRNRISVYADNVQSCSALLFGDSIIAYGQIGQKMLDEFTSRSKTLTLLGTLGTGENRNEGRAGWTSDNYFTNKQYKSVVNPFYNATSETFDFSYYMTNAGYASVDFVVLHIGANDLYNTALSDARERISDTADNICAMIDSILAFNPTQKIIVQLFSPVSSNVSYVGPVQQKLIRAKFANFNAYMLVLLSKYSTVRISNDYLILDPDTDISDNIHPNQGGMEKIGVELLSQINCWQQDS